MNRRDIFKIAGLAAVSGAAIGAERTIEDVLKPALKIDDGLPEEIHAGVTTYLRVKLNDVTMAYSALRRPFVSPHLDGRRYFASFQLERRQHSRLVNELLWPWLETKRMSNGALPCCNLRPDFLVTASSQRRPTLVGRKREIIGDIKNGARVNAIVDFYVVYRPEVSDGPIVATRLLGIQEIHP